MHIASSKLKQNTAVTRAKLFTLSCSHHTPYAFMNESSWITWKQLKVALYMGWTIVVRIQTPRCWWIFATLLKTHSGQLLHASGSVLLMSLPATFVVLWLRYTLNKLDTSSNGIYAVRDPQAGYVISTLLRWRLVVTTTALAWVSKSRRSLGLSIFALGTPIHRFLRWYK